MTDLTQISSTLTRCVQLSDEEREAIMELLKQGERARKGMKRLERFYRCKPEPYWKLRETKKGREIIAIDTVIKQIIKSRKGNLLSAISHSQEGKQ